MSIMGIQRPYPQLGLAFPIQTTQRLKSSLRVDFEVRSQDSLDFPLSQKSSSPAGDAGTHSVPLGFLHTLMASGAEVSDNALDTEGQ